MDASKLADRLRGIVGGSGPHAARPAGLPARDETAGAVSRPPADEIESALGGEWRALPDGRCFVVERRTAAESAHGRSRIKAFASAIEEALPSAAVLSHGTRPGTPLLFFDLETTGLSGGAGTYAFLIGCGWFEADGSFVTRQYVLTRLAEEQTVLRGFAAELARAGALVSFNGKTFDAPVLETRYLYHRLSWAGADLPHLDMLHPARRFWGLEGRSTPSSQSGIFSPTSAVSALNVAPLASCSLGSLEQRVLGSSRVGDVPGFEIPARYFQFLRSGDARPLAAVLEHNRLDLLSLAGVTARLLTLVHRGCAVVEQPAEALALGRIYARAGLDDRADVAYRRAAAVAATQSRGGWIRVESCRALARGARRRRQYDEAAEWWREVLKVNDCPREAAHEAHEALAIYHEHRLRDFESARTFALRILDETKRPAWADAVRHRLARIERKMRTPGSKEPGLL